MAWLNPAQSKEVFAHGMAESGAPEDIVWLLNYLLETVLDGRNAYICDGVQRALGREPADFANFAQRIAAHGTWAQPDKESVA